MSYLFKFAWISGLGPNKFAFLTGNDWWHFPKRQLWTGPPGEKPSGHLTDPAPIQLDWLIHWFQDLQQPGSGNPTTGWWWLEQSGLMGYNWDIIRIYQWDIFWFNGINGWLVVYGTWMDYDFPFSWEFHHPNWRTPSFFRGVGGSTTNQWLISLESNKFK